MENAKALSNWREPQDAGKTSRCLSFLSQERNCTSEGKANKRSRRIKLSRRANFSLEFRSNWSYRSRPLLYDRDPWKCRKPSDLLRDPPPAPTHPALIVLLILAPQRAPNYGSAEEHPSPFRPKPPARAEISGQLPWRRPSVLVPI